MQACACSMASIRARTSRVGTAATRNAASAVPASSAAMPSSSAAGLADSACAAVSCAACSLMCSARLLPITCCRGNAGTKPRAPARQRWLPVCVQQGGARQAVLSGHSLRTHGSC
jgi:hypothetical protein